MEINPEDTPPVDLLPSFTTLPPPPNSKLVKSLLTPPYDYIQELQTLETSISSAQPSMYTDRYVTLQQFNSKILTDLNNLKSISTQTDKTRTSDYSYLYTTEYVGNITTIIGIFILFRYIIAYF